MKKCKYLLVLLLALSLVFSCSWAVYAGDDDGDRDDGREVSSTIDDDDLDDDFEEDKDDDDDKDEDDEDIDEEEAEDEDIDDEDIDAEEFEEDLDEEVVKPWEAAKDALESEKDRIEALKDGVEQQIETLKLQYEQSKETASQEELDVLLSQIEQLSAEKESYFSQMKQLKEQMQEVMREKYTEEELAELNLITLQLQSDPGITVLPFTSVLVGDADVKFDTPPVIIEGRTLVPIRAIAEATGAEVEWNDAENKVTIKTESDVIELIIGNDTMTVNGVEVSLDTSAQVLNNRTIVPLRIIVESLDLAVEWDPETQTIEIE